jgi:hypothetical protein
MVSQRDLYNECQDMVSTILSLYCVRVKFNKLFCKVHANDYLNGFKYFNKYVFSEGDFINLPGYKTARVELRLNRVVWSDLVDTWTQKFWWVSVITSSDSASAVLHLREFLACVNVLVQKKINMIYGPPLVSVDSSVEEKSGSDIDSPILSMKRLQQRHTFCLKFCRTW